MIHYPIFVDIRKATVIVAGGDNAVAGKIRLVRKTTAHVKLFAEDLAEEVEALVAEGGIEHIKRDVTFCELKKAALIYVGTGDLEKDRMISQMGMALGRQVNVVDKPKLSNFVTPAIVDRSPLVVAIGSGGYAPSLARIVRASIDRMLPARIGKLAELAQDFRKNVRGALSSTRQQRRFWDEFFTGDIARIFLSGREADARNEAVRRLNGHEDAKGTIYLVPIASDDSEMLSIKAHRHLLQADMIISDNAIPKAFVELGRRDAEYMKVENLDDIREMIAEEAVHGADIVILVSRQAVLDHEWDTLKAMDLQVSMLPVVSDVTAMDASTSGLIGDQEETSSLRYKA